MTDDLSTVLGDPARPVANATRSKRRTKSDGSGCERPRSARARSAMDRWGAVRIAEADGLSLLTASLDRDRHTVTVTRGGRFSAADQVGFVAMAWDIAAALRSPTLPTPGYPACGRPRTRATRADRRRRSFLTRPVGRHQPVGDGHGQGLGAVSDAELPVDRPEMTLDGGLGQEQLDRRLLVARSLGERGEDMQLPFGQAVRSSSHAGRRATVMYVAVQDVLRHLRADHGRPWRTARIAVTKLSGSTSFRK